MAIITGSLRAKRVDGVGKYMPYDEDDNGLASIVGLSGGGFAVQWIADVDGDGEGDTLAIQRHDANGAEAGSTVLLSNLPDVLTSDYDNAPEIEGLSLTPLANGGYALTFAALLESNSRFLTINGGTPAPVGVLVVGRTVEIGFSSSIPDGATFSLSGTGPGGPLSVQLSVVDGAIEITRALLAQFAVQDRFTLNVAGVPAGQSVSFYVDSLETLRYDSATNLSAIDRSVVVGDNERAGLGAPGRVESFDIVSATAAAGKTLTYTMIIAPAAGPESINLTGIPGASIQPIGIVISGLVPDADGVIAVPASILSQIGSRDANISLSVGNLAPGSTLDASLAVREGIPHAEGVFVQTFGADGVATGGEPVRIDGPGNYVPDDEEDLPVANVVALPNGGFAVHWIADSDGDNEGDTFAIQRYDSAGEKAGSVLLLSGLPDALVDQDEGGETEALDLTPLANGGYALTYALQLEETYRHQILTAGANPVSTQIAGRPVEVNYTGPAGATFTLNGTGPGGPLSLQLTLVDGGINISRDMLSQFSIQDRFSLRVSGVPQGQSFSLDISGVQTRLYEADAVLQTEARSVTVANGGAGLNGLGGRVEAFDIESVTPSGANANYTMFIVAARGPDSIDISGMANTSITQTGIMVTGLAPDADGVIAVPAAILDQLGANDANIFLSIGGLANGSTLSATVFVRPFVSAPEGIFVQTFGADGVATGAEPVRIDGPGNYMPYDGGDDDEADSASVVALSDGGFAVQWIADINGDDDGDTFAIQRFDAAGAKAGSPVLLSNLPDTLTGENVDVDVEIESIDLTPLDGGGYALTYAVQLPEAYRFLTLTGGAPSIGVSFIGRPVDVYLASAVPPGVTFTLAGTGPNGQLLVPLTLSGNEIAIPRDLLSQFSVQDRFTIRVGGLPQGQTLTLSIDGVQTKAYDLSEALAAEARSVTVVNGGAALAAPGGRVESFDIEAATAAAGRTISYTMIIQTAREPSSFSLAGVPGASFAPAGIIINGLVPDGNGVIAVPASILAQLGQEDANIFLSVGNLETGSTLSATLAVRGAIILPEGVFVQTFDADGVAPGNQTLIGTESADEITGAGGNDLLQGLGGDDVIRARGGNDRLDGGAGNDQLFGEGGNDLLIAANVASLGGATTVYTFAGSSFDGGAGTDYLSVAGQVFFKGSLSSIEGIDLQPAAQLWLDAAAFLGATPQLAGNLSLRGNGTLVVDLAAGDSFDGSAFVFETGSAVNVRIEGSDDADGDVITGTSRNDVVNGQGGQDIAVFSGNRSDYTASMDGAGRVNIAGAASGNDSFGSVEIFRFTDGDYYWSASAGDLAPVVPGVVSDGYVAGATVFIDVDADGVLDANEPFTISDADGEFSFGTDAVGPIRAIGGTNADTGLPNLFVLSAPEGSTVVNPLTTLVHEAMEADPALSESQAETLVKAAFGIDPSIDLTTFDILGAAGDAGNPLRDAALNAQKAAASVIVVLGQVLEATGGSESSVDSALDALVATLDGAAVDLTDAALLESVFTASGVAQQEAQSRAQETSSFNTQIAAAATLNDIADVQEAAAPSIPLAKSDAVSTAESSVVTGSLFADNGSGADADPNGAALVIAAINGSGANVGSQITLASGARLTVNANGSYSYDPNGVFNTLTAIGSGALNTSATDSFTYTLNGGTTATVVVTIEGVAGAGDRLAGSGADNTIIGTSGGDLFLLDQGGNDAAAGGDGNDAFLLGAALTAADRIDGGAGDRDQLALQGDYAGLSFGAATMAGIEQIGFLSGSDTRFGAPGTDTHSYNLVMHDGNVVAGQQLVVQFNTLRAGENVTFNGSAELDGSFFSFGGQGTDFLTGSQNDDRFFFGADGRFAPGDKVDGQGGAGDQLGLQGDYSGANAVVFGADSLVGMELIGFLSGGNARFGSGAADGYDYDITMHDANVLAGRRLIVQSNDLRSNGVLDESLTFDGSAETDGHFTIFSGDGADDIIGGAGADIVFGRGGDDRLTGGGGADTLRGQGGNDVFGYLALSDSTAATRDSIIDFHAGDRIDVSALDAIYGGGDDAFSFIGDAAFSGAAGELRSAQNGAGAWLVEADANGDGIADLIITLTTLDPLYVPSATDFIL